MANIFKIKTDHCILFILNEITYYNPRCVSESFLLRDVKCKLLFELSGSTAYLYCESNLALIPAVDIIVVFTPKSDIFYGTPIPKSEFKRIKFTGIRQEIWRKYSDCNIWSCCTFEVITHEIPISKGGEAEEISLKSVPQKSQITSHLEDAVHFQALSRDFLTLLEDKSNFDVVINCEETKFHVHKIILESRSSVLSAMLKSNMVESKTGVINIEDISKPILECFLRYLFTGMLPEFCIETAKELYKAGDKYAVEELKKACSEYLNKYLSDGNACEILVLADLHSDKDFRKKVILYIVDKQLPQKDKKWSEFCSRHSSLAIEILNTFIERHCPK